jgi:hypothetical protein
MLPADPLQACLTATNRGPLIQLVTSNSSRVILRTAGRTTLRIAYGVNASTLSYIALSNVSRTDHDMPLLGLQPGTSYTYVITCMGNASTSPSVLPAQAFRTRPTVGTASPRGSFRIWAIGDFGTGMEGQFAVRDQYLQMSTVDRTDVWLVLGDNAYWSG